MYVQKRVLAVLLVLLGCTVLLAAKENSLGTAAKRTITFSQPTVVAGTLLPAGEYTLTHEMEGQTHVMTFKQIGGKAEAKAACNLVPVKGKVEQSEQHFTTNAKQQRVLTGMLFRGDTVEHVLQP